ncbi:SbcC/MukB-like Walker B domain-containing protein [Desulfosediminicola ganghwensis]|uniref:SbcC/MukB-like Walker B domain-containing protein n=1 Tax=Desulfosediminicola ganghwensis TaxID=2569540 RepID=UPI0010AC653A|nr:AAA family ATPase [Desulfosediminicola ganghwensis]
MKILQIRFCNLNSLAGNWSIDLTAGEYSSNGIFAITGPTGAGKTTILDAICLALYGKTPRLERVNKTSNEIMTRQTGECWAEVEFSTARGKFRCHWAQHRSRKSADGELQPSRHEIVDGNTNQVLESRKKQVEQKVIAVTGMSYEQFTRSILLAQGEFNTFLNARPDERAPILEQITGTEVYSQISRKVHEIKTRTQTTFDKLQSECDGFIPLMPEQVSEIESRRQELLIKSQLLEKKINELRHKLDWLQAQDQLAKEITEQNQQLSSATDEWQQLAPRRNQLMRAEKAEKIRPGYEHLKTTRALQEKERQEHALTARDLQKLAETINTTQAGRTTLQQELATQSLEDRELELIIRQVRELDKEITLTCKQLSDSQKEREAALNQQTSLLTKSRITLDELTGIEKENASIVSYFSDNRVDKQLISELSGIEQYSNRYLQLDQRNASLKQQIAAGVQQREKGARQVEAKQKQVKELTCQFNELQQEAQGIQDNLANLLKQHTLHSIEELFQQEGTLQANTQRINQLLDHRRELAEEITKLDRSNTLLKQQDEKRIQLNVQIEAAQKEYQQQAKAVQQQERVLRLAAKVESLEEERNKLQPGSPCPLCGATEHPYLSSGSLQVDDEEKLLKQEQALLEKSLQQLSGLTNTAAVTSATIEQLQQTLAELQQSIEMRRTRCDQLAKELNISTGPDFVGHLQDQQHQLNERLRKLHEVQQHCLQLKKTGENLSTKLDVTNKKVTEADRSLQKQMHEQDHLVRLHDQLLQNQKEYSTELKEQFEKLQTYLTPFVPKSLQGSNFSLILPELLVELNNRKEKWLHAEAREQKLALNFQKHHNEKTRLETQSAALEEQLTLVGKRLNSHQEHLDQLTQKRKDLFGERDPDTVLKERQQKKTLLEERFNNLSVKNEALLKEQAKLTERHTSLNERIRVREDDLRKQSQQHEIHLQAAGFADEADYLASHIEPDKLAEQVDILKKRESEIEKLRHLLNNTQAKLTIEQQKKLTERSTSELQEEQNQLTSELKELTHDSGALSQQLKTNEQQQRLHQQKLGQLTRQREVLEHWSQLHELIGSADGKKFRNFAQGLTFELMIHHANISLQQMTDRYLLVHNTQLPLELQVIDNYQAGEMRSTKNLSGGESFIVSMALALGLSNMASNTVQVDSLFLDEGFGTLDDEALQTALDTLSGLHQNGKLIGVISHISGLQERISTRIQVKKGAGGLSTLSGPGVL